MTAPIVVVDCPSPSIVAPRPTRSAAAGARRVAPPCSRSRTSRTCTPGREATEAAELIEPPQDAHQRVVGRLLGEVVALRARDRAELPPAPRELMSRHPDQHVVERRSSADHAGGTTRAAVERGVFGVSRHLDERRWSPGWAGAAGSWRWCRWRRRSYRGAMDGARGGRPARATRATPSTSTLRRAWTRTGGPRAPLGGRVSNADLQVFCRRSSVGRALHS